jgi:hypothetical protein
MLVAIQGGRDPLLAVLIQRGRGVGGLVGVDPDHHRHGAPCLEGQQGIPGRAGRLWAWRERRLVEDRMETFAEGLATRTAVELPQRILWQWLDDFLLVSDDEIRAAQVLMIEATRNLIEAAGAAPLAAALRLREQLAAKRIALIASGGNASRDQLLDLLK